MDRTSKGIAVIASLIFADYVKGLWDIYSFKNSYTPGNMAELGFLPFMFFWLLLSASAGFKASEYLSKHPKTFPKNFTFWVLALNVLAFVIVMIGFIATGSPALNVYKL